MVPNGQDMHEPDVLVLYLPASHPQAGYAPEHVSLLPPLPSPSLLSRHCSVPQARSWSQNLQFVQTFRVAWQ